VNERYAVVPEDVGVTETTNVLPPAVYPVPATSLEVVYTVVVASKDADEVYRAILYVLDEKFCVPLKSWTLKLVARVWVIAI
jgi:hypothetical protein